MKKNTTQFLYFINMLKNYNLNENLNDYLKINNIISCLRVNDFSIENDIIFEYTNKNIKPLDLKEKFYNNDIKNIYILTLNLNEEKSYNLYGFSYDGSTFKNKALFNFCNNYYYNYTSNAERRKNAVLTVLIYQNKKYFEAVKEKRNKRNQLKNEIFLKDRFYFIKDSFIETCTEPENQQRYKYIHKEYIKSIFTWNQVLKNKYRFSLSNSGWYYTGDSNIYEIDKSGYLLTYKRDELRRKANNLRAEKNKNNFILKELNYYIKTLNNIKNKIENHIFNYYKNLVEQKNIEGLLNNNLHDIKYLYNDVIYYIEKLNNKNFNSVELLKISLKDINNKYINLIESNRI